MRLRKISPRLDRVKSAMSSIPKVRRIQATGSHRKPKVGKEEHLPPQNHHASPNRHIRRIAAGTAMVLPNFIFPGQVKMMKASRLNKETLIPPMMDRRNGLTNSTFPNGLTFGRSRRDPTNGDGVPYSSSGHSDLSSPALSSQSAAERAKRLRIPPAKNTSKAARLYLSLNHQYNSKVGHCMRGRVSQSRTRFFQDAL